MQLADFPNQFSQCEKRYQGAVTIGAANRGGTSASVAKKRLEDF
jgi:hypothetical protein